MATDKEYFGYESMRILWDMSLVCEDEYDFNRALIYHGGLYHRPNDLAMQEGYRLLERSLVGSDKAQLHQYVFPRDQSNREKFQRVGKKMSFMEDTLLSRAYNEQLYLDERRLGFESYPPVEYVSGVYQRPESEIQTWIANYQRKGLVLP